MSSPLPWRAGSRSARAAYKAERPNEIRDDKVGHLEKHEREKHERERERTGGGKADEEKKRGDEEKCMKKGVTQLGCLRVR